MLNGPQYNTEGGGTECVPPPSVLEINAGR